MLTGKLAVCRFRTRRHIRVSRLALHSVPVFFQLSQIVITSYSIHYTKLYDNSAKASHSRAGTVREPSFVCRADEETMTNNGREHGIEIALESTVHGGLLGIPKGAEAIVVFAHGSGNSRFSRRNALVANTLRASGLATLVFDLLTEDEDSIYENRFNIDLLGQRLLGATRNNFV